MIFIDYFKPLKNLKNFMKCVGFFFFNNLIATNGCVCISGLLTTNFDISTKLNGKLEYTRCYVGV